MPMDILPAPTAAPAGAAAGASPTPSLAVPGSALAVFSRLLTQIAQTQIAQTQIAQTQIAPSPGSPALPTGPLTPVTVTSAGVTETLTAPSPAGAKPFSLAANTPTGTGKNKADSQDKPSLTDALWTPPVFDAPPPLPTVSPSASVSTDKARPGTAMDTAPLIGSELLSQTPAQSSRTTLSATTQTPIQAEVIVPMETTNENPPLPAAVSALVPPIAAQASQAVIVPAPLPAGTPPKSVRAIAAPQTTAAVPAGLSNPSPMPNAVPSSTTAVGIAAASPVSGSLQNSGAAADNQAGSQTGKNTETVTITPQESRVPPSSAKPTAAGKTVTADTAPISAGPPQDQSFSALGIALTASAPNGAAPPMPMPDRTRMVHQVADGVQTMALQTGGSGQRQVTLQLHPQDWGQLHVTVTMTPTTLADGKVNTQVVAHIVAETPTVKAALETHQTDLRQTLHSAGLHLDRLTITVQAPAGGAQAGWGNDRQPGTDSGGRDAQAQTTGTSAQSGTPFNGHGNNSQSAYAGFAQGETSRRPPMYSAGNAQTSDPETPGLTVASTDRSGLSSRVDLHA